MRKNSVDNLFKGSGSYTEAPRNSVGTLLADDYAIIGLSQEAA